MPGEYTNTSHTATIPRPLSNLTPIKSIPKTPTTTTQPLTLSTHNLNSIRNFQKKGKLEAYLKETKTHTFCAQEVKCDKATLDRTGVLATLKKHYKYVYVYNRTGSDRGYAGVMTCTDTKPKQVIYGFFNGTKDHDGRILTIIFNSHAVINVYVPCSTHNTCTSYKDRISKRQQFEHQLLLHTKDITTLIEGLPVFVAGDMNVAHTDKDYSLATKPDAHNTPGFTMAERNAFKNLMGTQFKDTGLHGEHTWQSRRTGQRESWRLDYILATKTTSTTPITLSIQNNVSDHKPFAISYTLPHTQPTDAANTTFTHSNLPAHNIPLNNITSDITPILHKFTSTLNSINFREHPAFAITPTPSETHPDLATTPQKADLLQHLQSTATQPSHLNFITPRELVQLRTPARCPITKQISFMRAGIRPQSLSDSGSQYSLARLDYILKAFNTNDISQIPGYQKETHISFQTANGSIMKPLGLFHPIIMISDKLQISNIAVYIVKELSFDVIFGMSFLSNETCPLSLNFHSPTTLSSLNHGILLTYKEVETNHNEHRTNIFAITHHTLQPNTENRIQITVDNPTCFDNKHTVYLPAINFTPGVFTKAGVYDANECQKDLSTGQLFCIVANFTNDVVQIPANSRIGDLVTFHEGEVHVSSDPKQSKKHAPHTGETTTETRYSKRDPRCRHQKHVQKWTTATATHNTTHSPNPSTTTTSSNTTNTKRKYEKREREREMRKRTCANNTRDAHTNEKNGARDAHTNEKNGARDAHTNEKNGARDAHTNACKQHHHFQTTTPTSPTTSSSPTSILHTQISTYPTSTTSTTPANSNKFTHATPTTTTSLIASVNAQQTTNNPITNTKFTTTITTTTETHQSTYNTNSNINNTINDTTTSNTTQNNSQDEEFPIHPDIDLTGAAKLTPQQMKCLRRSLHTHGTLFDKPTYHTKPTHGFELDIQIPHGTPPIRVAPRHACKPQRDIMEQYIDKHKKSGLIEDSVSPWAAPVILTLKKDGTHRVVLDYRGLNRISNAPSSFPLIRADDQLQALAGSKYLSCIDLTSAYHNIPLSDATKNLTAFSSCTGGHYQYTRLPMGLSQSMSIFNAFAHNLFKGLSWRSLVFYVDDVIIHSTSIDQHLKDIEDVLTRLHTHDVKINPAKSHFFADHLLFCGHVISPEGIQCDPKRTTAINNMQQPQTSTQLRSFLGCCNFYRRYIRNYACKTKILQDLLKQGVSVSKKWTEHCTQAFEKLKLELTGSNILIHPDFNKPFILSTDWCINGIGAVLAQMVDGHERPVAFISRSLRPAEENYTAFEGELLAVVWATEVFRPYLAGQKFQLFTDHKALISLEKSKVGRVLRWINHLQEFEYDIEHRKGEHNANSDCPSRLPLSDDIHLTTPVPVLPITRTQTNTLTRPTSYTKTSKTTSRSTPQSKTPTQSKQNTDKNTPLTSSENIPKSPATQTNTLPNLNTTRTKLFDTDTFIQAQKQDPFIKSIYNSITNPKHKYEPTYILLNKIIYRKRTCSENDTHRYREGNGMQEAPFSIQAVVPTSLIGNILTHYHSLPIHSHAGSTATIKSIAHYYWWPHCTQHIRKYVRSCLPCQARKTPRRMRFSIAGKLQKSRPFQMLYIDLVGPLRPSAKGNTNILTCICAFTRWPIAIPLPNKRTKTIADALYNHVFLQFGTIEHVHSDKEHVFENEELKTALLEFNCKYSCTTGYNPQANGMIERFHRYLGSSLTILSSTYKDNWDEHLNEALFTYRCSTNTTTGFSPFELIFGRAPILPLNLSTHPLHIFDSEQEYASTQAQSMAEMYQKAQITQERQQAKNRHHININNPPLLKPQDTVLLWEPLRIYNKHKLPKADDSNSTSRKLFNKWSGPHTVIQHCHSMVYKIKRSDNQEIETHHVNRLALYDPWNEQIPDTSITTAQSGMSTTCEDTHNNCNPQVLDLTIMLLDTAPENKEDFCICKVLKIETDGTYHVHYYGNQRGFNPTAPFIPGWVDAKGIVYYNKIKTHNSHQPFTNKTKNWECTFSRATALFGPISLTNTNHIPTQLKYDMDKCTHIKHTFTHLRNNQ